MFVQPGEELADKGVDFAVSAEFLELDAFDVGDSAVAPGSVEGGVRSEVFVVVGFVDLDGTRPAGSGDEEVRAQVLPLPTRAFGSGKIAMVESCGSCAFARFNAS
ncbi:hypothetical protein ACF063_05825 [Streptomyces chartreusis]|uniref:hypothetical protein n=1 Tax=Streptomyces chartreusis TaxID=1969 RepID=UPI0036FF7360